MFNGNDLLEDDLEILEILEHGFPRKVYIRSNYFDALDDEQFIKRYRLSKASVLNVLELIEDEIEFPNNKNNSVTPINQLLLTLRLYATGSHLLCVADYAGMHVSTVSRIVVRVTKAICRLARRFIHFPNTSAEIKETQNGFFNISSFPKVIAAIDCTHVKIQSPGGEDPEVFRNRKNYFSLNIQGMCNANYELTDIVARWPGSVHDSTIFNNSIRKMRFEEGTYPNCIILGDSGYNLRSYLYTPLLNPMSDAEQLYNEAHIRTRNVIERTFGIWKRRFPILAYGSRLKVETVQYVVVATAILHNIARQNIEEPPLPNDIDEHVFQQLLANGNIPLNPQMICANRDIIEGRRNLIQDYFGRL